MTTPGFGGGQVDVPIVADAEGFSRGLQAKLDAALASIRARVRLEADSSDLRGQVAIAARQAEAGESIRIRTKLAGDGLREKVDALAEEAGAGETVSVSAKLADDASERLRAEVDKAKLELEGESITIRVKVKRDESGLFTSGVGGGGGGGGEDDVVGGLEDVEGESSSLSGSLSGLSGVGLIAAAALFVLAGGGAAAAGALGILAGSIGPLLGLLAALPGIASVGGAVLGTLFAGLSGISKAVSGLGAAQSSGGESASAYADAQRSAAERVEQAQHSLQQAQQSVRDTVITNAEQQKQAAQDLANTEVEASDRRIAAARAVADASYQLGIAERSLADAETNLANAQQAAQRGLEDSANQAADAALSAQQAQLSLEEAQKNLADTSANPNSTALQTQEASLGVTQAQQQLQEAQLQASRAAADNVAAQKAGVSGNAAVKSAVEQVTDAQHTLQQAVQGVTDAQKAQAREVVTDQQAIEAAVQRVADVQRTSAEATANAAYQLQQAEQGVTDSLIAQKEAAAGVGGAASAAQSALAKLTPAGQAFAKFIRGVIDGPIAELKVKAQNALLPGLQTALEKVVGPGGIFPQLDSVVVNTASGFDVLANHAATALSSPVFRTFLTTLGTSTKSILTTLAPGVQALIDGFTRLATAALPLVERFAAGLTAAAEHFDGLITKGQQTGGLTRFFDQVYTTTHAWGQILEGIGSIIVGIVRAAVPAGNEFNSALEGGTKQLATYVNSVAGQNKLKAFFASALPVLEEFGRLIGAVFKVATAANSNAALASIFQTISDTAPAIAAFLSTAGPSFVATLGALTKGISDVIRVLGPAAPLIGKVIGPLLAFGLAAKTAVSVAGKIGETVGAIEKVAGTVGQIAGGIADLRAVLINAGIATKIFAGAQAALDVVLDANPIVLIVLALIALGVAFYEAYKHIGPFRDIVNDIGRFLKKIAVEGFDFVRSHLKLFLVGLALATGPIGIFVGLAVLIVKHFGAIVDFFKALPGDILDALKDVGTFVANLFTKAFDFVKTAVVAGLKLLLDLYVRWPLDVIKALADFGLHLAETIGKALVTMGTAIAAGLLNAVNFFVALPGRVIAAISGFGEKLASAAAGFLGKMLSGFTDAVGDVVGFFTGLPAKILNALGNVDTMLLDAGKRIIEGLVKGIGNAAGDVKDAVTGVVSSITSHFPFSPAKEGPLRDHPPETMGGNVARLIAKGIAAASPSVKDAVAGVAGTISDGLDGVNTTVGIAPSATALGGRLARATKTTAGSLTDALSAALSGATGGDITVYNPIPEPASTSIATRLRRQGVLKGDPKLTSPTNRPTTYATA